jgi:hypothetical protein
MRTAAIIALIGGTSAKTLTWGECADKYSTDYIKGSNCKTDFPLATTKDIGDCVYGAVSDSNKGLCTWDACKSNLTMGNCKDAYPSAKNDDTSAC